MKAIPSSNGMGSGNAATPDKRNRPASTEEVGRGESWLSLRVEWCNAMRALPGSHDRLGPAAERGVPGDHHDEVDGVRKVRKCVEDFSRTWTGEQPLKTVDQERDSRL
ncbi:MAG TPA: hypothetical protein VFK02_00610 [Kofleriaceae bacterium]|nr:hypothetical protein [Kofleriaceae bacterium]